MTHRNVVLGGAALSVASLFAPIVTLPIVGSVNLFNGGTNIAGLILLALAALAAGLALTGRERLTVWPGIAASAVLLYLFLRLQYSISQMRESLATELADNPFAGLAQGALSAVQLQWGWLSLAAGAGAIVYGALKARTEDEPAPFAMGDSPARLVAGASILLFAVAVLQDLYGQLGQEAPIGEEGAVASAANDALAGAAAVRADPTAAGGPTAEEARYIRDHLELYDLDAKYFDSILDGRVPGVRFKLKNAGQRTLNEVSVRVMFQDAEGKTIAEEQYYPVLVSEYSYSGDNSPLRPNYIWQQDPDQFYAAKGVPTEWKTGAATARIVDIEFGPDE